MKNLHTPLAALCVACMLALPQASIAQRASREPVTLNFVNADIDAVARTMAAITGRNIVVDPRVKGSITLSTDKPVSPNAAYNQFLATLRLSGFAAVEASGITKVVPEADAKLQGGAVTTVVPSASSEIVTQIFRLNHESASNLVPILRPLITPNNTINVDPGSNALVITDYADNLQRIARIVSALDVSNATDVDVIPLKYALAPDLAPIVQRLAEAGGGTGTPVQGQADTSFRTTVIAESRSNSLIVRASNAARLGLVRSIVQRLDTPSSQNATGNIYVVYLKNADATKLAITLRAAIAASGSSAAGGGGGNPIAATSSTTPLGAGSTAAGSSPATAPTQPSAQPSTGGQIQADPATNSLIITAAEPQYRQIRAVIDKLDSRRAQVYVESLIAEVNADKEAEFGIQWQTNLGNKGDKNIGLLGTNFTTGTTNLISLAASQGNGSVAPTNGVNLGILRNINGKYVLGALANFLQTTGDGNVLSTPNLLTLDNEEAKIVIGQNVPFVTGQYTNAQTGTNGTVNPFQTIERKDVGLTLRVKPQISENGTVKLQIFQEVSSVDPSSVNSTSGLITNKRSIESSILVDDGGIVVLGGLLQDEYADNQQKVPGLGDVPVLGNLFKSETRSRKKTNLMVFLRPVVIRDAASSDVLSLDRYDLMRNMGLNAQPTTATLLQPNTAPVLPQLNVVPRPAGAAPASPDAAPAAPGTAPAAVAPQPMLRPDRN